MYNTHLGFAPKVALTARLGPNESTQEKAGRVNVKSPYIIPIHMIPESQALRVSLSKVVS